MSTKTVPYETATSGQKARDEITKLLHALGCERIGFMDDFADGTVLLQFSHRGREVQLKGSAYGWAQMFLRMKPYSTRQRKTRKDYEQAALRQGLVAVNSILRDWVKGQVTAIECGVLPFEQAFMPHIITDNGRPVYERILESGNLLPPPTASEH